MFNAIFVCLFPFLIAAFVFLDHNTCKRVTLVWGKNKVVSYLHLIFTNSRLDEWQTLHEIFH